MKSAQLTGIVTRARGGRKIRILLGQTYEIGVVWQKILSKHWKIGSIMNNSIYF